MRGRRAIPQYKPDDAGTYPREGDLIPNIGGLVAQHRCQCDGPELKLRESSHRVTVTQRRGPKKKLDSAVLMLLCDAIGEAACRWG